MQGCVGAQGCIVLGCDVVGCAVLGCVGVVCGVVFELVGCSQGYLTSVARTFVVVSYVSGSISTPNGRLASMPPWRRNWCFAPSYSALYAADLKPCAVQ